MRARCSSCPDPAPSRHWALSAASRHGADTSTTGRLRTGSTGSLGPPHIPTSEGASMAHPENEILEGLAEIVNEETGVATEDVKLDKSFTDDLDIDSISMMTIVVNAEEKFDVRIPDEEVKNLATVGDAVKYIEGAQN